MNTGLTHKDFDNSTGRQVNSVHGGVAFKSMLDTEEQALINESE